MPHRVEQRCRATAHAALRAGFDGGLEVFVERNTAGMEGFTATDRAAQRADAAGVDTDAGALRDVFHNGAGGGVDGVRLSPHSISTQELNWRVGVRTPDMIGVGSEILKVEIAS